MRINETIDLIARRASVRAFDGRPIAPETEQAILRAALRAPTAGNMMLYTILRVHDAETRRKLAVTCDNQPFIAEAPLTLIFLADFTRWEGLYRAAGVPKLAAERGIPWGGPTVADLMLCVSDALIAAQTAVVAAQSLGVCSCYIGDIMEQYETHRQLFDLPPRAFPVAMLCLGYPRGALPAPRPRYDERFIVHDEVYRRFSDEELLEMARRDGADPVERTGRFFLRKNGAAFAREMERSVALAMKTFLEG